jgi:2'-5' RNA ligase
MPEALTSLAMDLHDGALKCGIPMDARPYRAHVTLSRKVARAPARMEISPFVWEVDRFALVKSITISGDVKYAVIREWPLVRTD